MSLTYLNDVWSLYFHDPYDMNWETNSYKLNRKTKDNYI